MTLEELKKRKEKLNEKYEEAIRATKYDIKTGAIIGIAVELECITITLTAIFEEMKVANERS